MMSASLMSCARKRNAATPITIFGSKLMSWHRADLGVTLSSSEVTDWADQSGNGHDFSAAAGDRPTVGSVGGQDALYFEATNTEYLTLSGTGYGSPSALHVIRVMQRLDDPPATTQKSGLDDWGTSAAKSHVPFTDSNVYDSTGGSSRATVGNPSTSLATHCVYESVSTGSAFKAILNGTTIYSGSSLGVAVAGTPWIGGGSHGAYMDGYISEVIVLNAEASAGERTDFAAYILDRYGISI